MSQYSEARESVHSDLVANGAAVTYRTVVGQSVVGATGALVPGTTQDTATYALIKSYKAKEIDGSVIQRGDMRAMVSAKPFVDAAREPEVGGTLLIAGHEWRVLNVDTLQPGGELVLYWLQLRR